MGNFAEDSSVQDQNFMILDRNQPNISRLTDGKIEIYLFLKCPVQRNDKKRSLNLTVIVNYCFHSVNQSIRFASNKEAEQNNETA